ncbi:MAG TPA: hypothetical protein GX697_01630 [Firmicutes bacterium]|nr:hypothetical protein [Bacillota bacterium]
MDFRSSLLFLVSILLLLFLKIWGSVLLLRRSNRYIIMKLREKNAFSPEQAISKEDLGIKKQSLLAKMVKAPDNRLQALDFLLKADVIIATEEGLVYLSRERLAAIQTGQDKKELRYLLPPEL